jgi:hypothetical protein
MPDRKMPRRSGFLLPILYILNCTHKYNGDIIYKSIRHKEASNLIQTAARRAVAIAGTATAVNLAEGRYEIFSNTLNSRTASLESNIDYVYKTVNQLNLGPSATKFLNKLESIQGIIKESDYDSIEKIAEALESSGKKYSESITTPDQNQRQKREKMFLEEANNSSSKMEEATASFDKIIRMCVDYQRALHKGTKLASTQTPGITLTPDRYLISIKDEISKMVSPFGTTASAKISSLSSASRRVEPTFISQTENENANGQSATAMDSVGKNIINAIISREELNMVRMARLRLSFAAGNQVGDASRIAIDYHLRYQKEKKTKEMTIAKLKSLIAEDQFDKAAELTLKENLQREDVNGLGKKFKKALADLYDKIAEKPPQEKNITSSKSEKNLLKSQFLENESEELAKKIKEAQSHLRTHRKLDKKTMESINGSNVRLVSLYKIAEDTLNLNERNTLLEKIEEINGEIEKLAKTANGFGQKLKVSTSVVLENEKLEALKKAFNESANSIDFSLILMNDINQKDIYRYFKFMDKQHVFIGEFMLAILELKALKNSSEAVYQDPQDGSKNPVPKDNVHPFPTSTIQKGTTTTPNVAKSPAPASSTADLRPSILEEGGADAS